MSIKDNLVHEAEAQRQHVRLQMPLTVKLGGETLTAFDWSVGGLSLSTERKDLVLGTVWTSDLIFEFHEFEVSVPATLEVVTVNHPLRRIGCRFANVTPAQVSILQFMVGKYLAGEAIRVGDIWDISRRDHLVKARKEVMTEPPLSPSARRLAALNRAGRYAAVAVLSAVVALFLLTSIYQTLFTIEADSAVVTVESTLALSPSAGRLVYSAKQLVGARISAGTPLFSVVTVSGNSVFVDSPCDCVIQKFLAAPESQVSTGSPVVVLAQVQSAPFIQATVRVKEAVLLVGGQPASIEMPGMGTNVSGRVLKVSVDPDEPSRATAIISADSAVPASMIGFPARVRFDTFRSSPLGHLLSGRGPAGQ